MLRERMFPFYLCLSFALAIKEKKNMPIKYFMNDMLVIMRVDLYRF